MKNKMKLLFPCYFAFFSNGAMALLVGAILPELMAEAKISYSAAGGILSIFAIGNLVASFVNPVLARTLGRKVTIIITSMWIPICYFSITMIPSLSVIYFMFFMCGIGRGSCSIFNNGVVNDISNGDPAALSFLHMIFAIGAFIAPFLKTVYYALGFEWRAIVYTIVVLSSLATLGYFTIKLDDSNIRKGGEKKNSSEEYSCFKVPDFYILGILLFFYLGLENCVNGWFVTYFKNIGIMSDNYATNLVSLTWVMVLLGRFVTAKIASKVGQNLLILCYCIATGVCFLLLISTHNLILLTIAIAGIGFFMAGIYPSGVSSCGKYIKGSTTGMSMLLAMAAIGGIITPKIIGVIADQINMTVAVMVLTINMLGMIVLASVNIMRQKGRKA